MGREEKIIHEAIKRLQENHKEEFFNLLEECDRGLERDGGFIR